MAIKYCTIVPISVIKSIYGNKLLPNGGTMDDKAIGRRIKDERERRDISQNRLAELAGIAHRQSIGRIEDGDRKLQAVELYGIANALGVRAEYLLGLDGTNKTGQPFYLWRNLSADNKSEWENKFSTHISNLKYVESVLSLDSTATTLPHHSIDIEKADENSIYSLADSIRTQLGLGSFPAESLFKTLEEKFNVRIFFVDLHDAGSAATTRSSNEAVIFLDMFEPPWRRIFSLAHELFHIVTWSDDIAKRAQEDQAFHNKNEKLAEAFAAGLLMPYEMLNVELGKGLKDGKLTYIDIISLARMFGVSTQALLYSMQLRFPKPDSQRCARSLSLM